MTRKLSESSVGDENDCLKDKIFEEVKSYLQASITQLGYNDSALEKFALAVLAQSFQRWSARIGAVSSDTLRVLYQGKPDVVLRQSLAGYSLEDFLKKSMEQREEHISEEHFSNAKTDPIGLRNAKTDSVGLRNAKTDSVAFRRAKTTAKAMRAVRGR